MNILTVDQPNYPRCSVHRPKAFQAIHFPEQSSNGGICCCNIIGGTFTLPFYMIKCDVFQDQLQGSGHGIAAARMEAKLNVAGWINEQMGGVRYILT